MPHLFFSKVNSVIQMWCERCVKKIWRCEIQTLRLGHYILADFDLQMQIGPCIAIHSSTNRLYFMYPQFSICIPHDRVKWSICPIRFSLTACHHLHYYQRSCTITTTVRRRRAKKFSFYKPFLKTYFGKHILKRIIYILKRLFWKFCSEKLISKCIWCVLKILFQNICSEKYISWILKTVLYEKSFHNEIWKSL